MQKRAFLIHGWGGYPEEGWRPWLEEALLKHGIQAVSPAMPDTNTPQMEKWIEHIHSVVGEPDQETYLLGHSLGSIAILRYLETFKEKQKVGGVVLIAGFTDDLGVPELRNFFLKPIDWEKIKSVCSKYISIESDNDPYNLAPYNEAFKKYLGAETLLEHNMMHFSGDDGISELPIALESVLKLAS